MNDFTKEELEELVDIINDAHKGTQRHGLEMHFPLRDKIQSMIDEGKYMPCSPEIIKGEE